GSETSTATAAARPPAARSCSTVSPAEASSMSAATTAAPSAARRVADARPIPDPAPVTRATFPAKRSSTGTLLPLDAGLALFLDRRQRFPVVLADEGEQLQPHRVIEAVGRPLLHVRVTRRLVLTAGDRR